MKRKEKPENIARECSSAVCVQIAGMIGKSSIFNPRVRSKRLNKHRSWARSFSLFSREIPLGKQSCECKNAMDEFAEILRNRHRFAFRISQKNRPFATVGNLPRDRVAFMIIIIIIRAETHTNSKQLSKEDPRGDRQDARGRWWRERDE